MTAASAVRTSFSDLKSDAKLLFSEWPIPLHSINRNKPGLFEVCQTWGEGARPVTPLFEGR